MRYALLIYSAQNEPALSQAEVTEMYAGHARFGAELGALGKIKGSAELQAPETAAVVKIRNGETLSTDGPFMETKEQLGGFYLIEAENLDEAKEWAAKIPETATTVIEVRPVVER